jgi:flavodoxin/NAD-dependent dihydropyrimidine dehydrogenase PreA subunit
MACVAEGEIMILYFSGTGNSKYVAGIIAEKNNDELVSINYLLKQGKPNKLESLSKPYVIVCPTYAWRIPRVVEDFIKASDFTGRSEFYLIMTCGSDTANAVGYFKRLCKEKGFVLQGFAEIIMPDNYLVMYDGVKKDVANQIIHKANPQIYEIAEKIKEEATFPDFIPKSKIKSGIVNDIFYLMYVNAKGFHTSDKCTGCKKCEQLCPLNNIETQKSKPRWGDKCTHCMACICGCPVGAIEYKKKTQGKVRHYLIND